jgi:glycosyltransferase 2 family protein
MPLRKKVFSILQVILFLGLGVFLAWLSLNSIGKEGMAKMKDSLVHARYWLIVPTFLLLILSHWSRAVRWKVLMEPLGHQPRVSNTFFAVMAGYLVNLGIPRMGEVVKCTILARYEKVPADKLVGTIVAERAFDLICLLIVFGFTLLLDYDVFIRMTSSDALKQYFLNAEGGFSYNKILIIVAGFAAFIVLMRYIFRRFGNNPVIARIRGFSRGIYAGLTSVRFLKRKGLFFFHTFLIWFLYLASTRLAFLALGASSHLGMDAAFTVLFFGSLGMMATPGGIGAYPWIVAQALVLHQLDEPNANALSWLMWSVQTAVTILLGIVSLVLLPYYNRHNHHAKDRQHTG